MRKDCVLLGESKSGVAAYLFVFLLIPLFLLNGCSHLPSEAVATHTLYRGGQPDNSEAGQVLGLDVKSILGTGITSIVNLELIHDDLGTIRQATVNNRELLALEYFRIKDWEPLPLFAPQIEDRRVIRFLAIANQSRSTPIFVHCSAGRNRTGVMVAAYKIIFPTGLDIAAEDEAYLAGVIEDMKLHGGFWVYFDAIYIRRLWARRESVREIIAKTGAEPAVHLICRNGKCDID